MRDGVEVDGAGLAPAVLNSRSPYSVFLTSTAVVDLKVCSFVGRGPGPRVPTSCQWQWKCCGNGDP